MACHFRRNTWVFSLQQQHWHRPLPTSTKPAHSLVPVSHRAPLDSKETLTKLWRRHFAVFPFSLLVMGRFHSNSVFNMSKYSCNTNSMACFFVTLQNKHAVLKMSSKITNSLYTWMGHWKTEGTVVATGLILCPSLAHLIPKYKDVKVVNLVPLQITIQTGKKLMSVHTNVYRQWQIWQMRERKETLLLW